MLFGLYYSVSYFAAPSAWAHFGDSTWQHSWRTAAQPFTQALSLWSTWTAVMYSEVWKMKPCGPLRKYAKILLFLAIWYFMLRTISTKENSCQSFYMWWIFVPINHFCRCLKCLIACKLTSYVWIISSLRSIFFLIKVKYIWYLTSEFSICKKGLCHLTRSCLQPGVYAYYLFFFSFLFFTPFCN